MSLYQCEECGCVENTAVGQYHCRDGDVYPEPYKGRALCSACGSPKYSDGSPTEFGKWHGRFKRRFYPKGTLYTDREGNVRDKETHKYPEAE